MKTNQKLSLTVTGLLLLVLTGCVNLKTLNTYSEESIEAVKKYEEINFSFEQTCKTNCGLQENSIENLLSDSYTQISKTSECECDMYLKADSSFNKIYFAINQYLNGLQKLSSDDILEFKYDTLSKALKETDLLDVKGEEIDAFKKLVDLTTRCIVDVKRRKNLQEIIAEGNAPFAILIDNLKYATSEILVENLDTELMIRYSYYQDAIAYKDTLFSVKEFLELEQEFISHRKEIEKKITLLKDYSIILDEVKVGHQKIYENKDKIHKKELAELLSKYITEINELKSDFETLNTK